MGSTSQYTISHSLEDASGGQSVIQGVWLLGWHAFTVTMPCECCHLDEYSLSVSASKVGVQ